jgi:hypothetical protein
MNGLAAVVRGALTFMMECRVGCARCVCVYAMRGALRGDGSDDISDTGDGLRSEGCGETGWMKMRRSRADLRPDYSSRDRTARIGYGMERGRMAGGQRRKQSDDHEAVLIRGQ